MRPGKFWKFGRKEKGQATTIAPENQANPLGKKTTAGEVLLNYFNINALIEFNLEDIR